MAHRRPHKVARRAQFPLHTDKRSPSHSQTHRRTACCNRLSSAKKHGNRGWPAFQDRHGLPPANNWAWFGRSPAKLRISDRAWRSSKTKPDRRPRWCWAGSRYCAGAPECPGSPQNPGCSWLAPLCFESCRRGYRVIEQLRIAGLEPAVFSFKPLGFFLDQRLQLEKT